MKAYVKELHKVESSKQISSIESEVYVKWNYPDKGFSFYFRNAGECVSIDLK